MRTLRTKSEITTADYILSNLFVEMGSITKWSEKLNEICYESVRGTDLIAVYRVNVGEEKLFTYVLTKAIADEAGITDSELRSAIEKKINSAEYQTMSLAEMLSDLSGQSVDDFDTGEPITVLTNKGKMFGSSVILRTDILDRVAENYGGRMYVLPSSIHEVLCVNTAIMAYDEAMEMVRSVNETVVDPKEVMSDHPYVYVKGTGFGN